MFYDRHLCFQSFLVDNTTYPLSDDPYEIIKSSFPSTCPDDLSMSQYWLLQDVVDELPSNRQEGSRPVISDETGMSETEHLIEQMKAVRLGGRSGGAGGFVVGVLGGWINHGLDCKRVGTQAGEITAKDLHDMEVRPGHPLSPWTIFRAGMYGGRSGYAGGEVVAAPGGNAVGRAVGGVIGGSVGYTVATGKSLWRGITSLFEFSGLVFLCRIPY